MIQERYRVGIDVGGTFTDFILFNETTGELITGKQESTPKAPGEVVIKGLKEIIEKGGIAPETISYLAHGCTIATNAIIQGKGVKAGLLVTKGFRNMLEIGRLDTVSRQSLLTEKRVLLPLRLIREIRGRLSSSGEVEEPLCEEDVLQAISELSQEGVKSIAVCLLHSYANPEHEEKVKQIIEKALPEVDVSLSSELWPEIKEYERACITVMNASIRPLMDEYLSEVEEWVSNLGVKAPIYIPKLNGGLTTSGSSRENPIATVTSGPTSGVTAAAYVAKMLGIDRVISFDMGGTSADFGYIEEGEPVYSTEAMVGSFPVTMPSVWVTSIGAGGGSIAWLDPTGVLKVGPQSAGADPGPACYGKGGTQATITDACLVCGYLSEDTPFAGNIRLNKKLAEEAISKIADKLGVGILDAAEGILLIAHAMMTKEIYALISKRGFDPRDSSLIPFGGAGSMVAHFLLDEFKLKDIVIVPYPGTFSALGGIASDIRQDAIKTLHQDIDSLGIEAIRDEYNQMQENLKSWIKGEGLPVQRTYIRDSADMKYIRQAFELEIPVSEAIIDEGIGALKKAFHQTHERLYKHYDEKAPVEVLNLRATIIGEFPKLELGEISRAEDKTPGVCGMRDMYYQGKKYKANIYRRKDLRYGHVLTGPAIIEQEDTTTILPVGFTGEVNKLGFIIIKKEVRDD